MARSINSVEHVLCAGLKTFAPLHALWMQYVLGVLQQARNREECLMSVDLHGCFLRLVKCRNRRHEGISGVVDREGARNIRIVTSQDQVIIIARQNAVVEWQIGDMIVSMRLAR